MEPAQRTRWIQLGVLGVVLVAVVYFVLMPAWRRRSRRRARWRPRPAARRPSRRRGRSDVRLDALGRAVAGRGPKARAAIRSGWARPRRRRRPKGRWRRARAEAGDAGRRGAGAAAGAAASAAHPVPVHRRALGRAGTGTHRRADRRPHRRARPGQRDHRGALPHRADRRGVAPDRARRWARSPDAPSAGTIDRWRAPSRRGAPTSKRESGTMPMSRGRRHVAGALAAVLLAMAVSGCADEPNYRRGEELARAGDWDSAVAYYTKALQENPDRPDYKISLERAMLKAAQRPPRHGARARSQGRRRERAGRVPQGRSSTRPSNSHAITRRGELERQAREKADASRAPARIDTMRERARRQRKGRSSTRPRRRRSA